MTRLPSARWITSQRAGDVFEICAWITVGVFAVGLIVTICAENLVFESSDWQWHSGWYLLSIVLVVIAMLLLAQLTVWFGMLWAMTSSDAWPTGFKVIWAIVLLCGGPWISTIYYFLFYRPLIRRKPA